MEIEITGVERTSDDRNRVVIKIDSVDITSLLLDDNEVINTNTAEVAIRKKLDGKKLIGHCFTI